MPGVAAFYEPLSESLASLTPGALALRHAGSWESGHHFLDRPYFAEFLPLLADKRPGVRGYHSSFATDDFFASGGDASAHLEDYLRLLLTTAETRGEQPVFKFCRSLGRIGWMQQHFPEAIHVVVLRNPLAQFESARRQLVLHGNAFFLTAPLLLLAMHRHLPTVRICAQRLSVELPDLAGCLTTEDRTAMCEASLRHSGPAAWYRVFLTFWAVTAATVPDPVDRIIDSDLLVGSRCYREECEFELAALTGRSVSFDAVYGEGFGVADEYRPRCAEILAANRAAEAFLIDRAGLLTWCDNPALARAARMLSESSLRALAVGTAQPAPEQLGLPMRSDADAASRMITRRAMRAEQELAAVRASRSWRMTAPFRSSRTWLAQAFASGAERFWPMHNGKNRRRADGQDFLPHQASIR